MKKVRTSIFSHQIFSTAEIKWVYAFFQNSYWFDCNCNACANNFPSLQKLPRDYLKLSGTHFKYKRCNRKELQKDVDKLKKRIRATILDEKIPVTLEVPNHYEATRKMFHDWMNLLDELLVPASHQVPSIECHSGRKKLKKSSGQKKLAKSNKSISRKKIFSHPKYSLVMT